MGPSWAKMGSGSELDVIFGHLSPKMEAKFDLEAVLRRSWGVLRRSWPVLRRSWGGRRRIWRKLTSGVLGNIAGTGGPRNVFNVLLDLE